ncbi:MAG: hypothetical protein M3Q34_02915 [bacterium]|nr:hypothetical protein [bacterium]
MDKYQSFLRNEKTQQGKQSVPSVSLEGTLEGSLESNDLDLPGGIADDSLEKIEGKLNREDIRKFILSVLSDKQRQIIELYYGFTDEGRFTDKEIDEKLGYDMGAKRIQELRTKALANLKKRRSELLKEYLN